MESRTTPVIVSATAGEQTDATLTSEVNVLAHLGRLCSKPLLHKTGKTFPECGHRSGAGLSERGRGERQLRTSLSLALFPGVPGSEVPATHSRAVGLTSAHPQTLSPELLLSETKLIQ